MNNNFIPLSIPHLKGNELNYLSECISSGWVSSVGQFVDKFENVLCKYTKAKHAVACSSGTTALHISLILFGITKDEEVIVPTITFIAPINAVKYVGAHPVFMDCDDYLNIDADKLKEFCERECYWRDNRLINKNTGRIVRAIIPVHVFGHPAQMEQIMEIAHKYNLAVIEDATESLGSYYKTGIYKGRKTGTLGNIGCYSFNGNKIITTGGGGMIVTDDSDIAEKAKYLTTQAKDDDQLFIHNEIGFNYRLTNIQAALGVAQMEQIDNFISIKRNNYAKYNELISSYKGMKLLSEPPYAFSNYWHYSLVIDSDIVGINSIELMDKLKIFNIQTRPLWQLNHLQRMYKDNLAYRIEKAYHYYSRILSIPCSVNISESAINKVADKIKKIIGYE